MDDLKNVKLVVCTPELSATIIKAVKKSNYACNNATQIVCLGEASECLNLFELLDKVKEDEALEPVTIDDAEKEKLIVYWSSGTTGTISDNMFLYVGNFQE